MKRSACGSEVGNVDPAGLWISGDLAAKLERWAATYDSHLNLSDPAATSWTKEEERNFDADGRRLCRMLAKEVAGRFSVFYFDPISKHCVAVEALSSDEPNG